jgi:hypothetical protein
MASSKAEKRAENTVDSTAASTVAMLGVNTVGQWESQTVVKLVASKVSPMAAW